jgi:hypothetical protein
MITNTAPRTAKPPAPSAARLASIIGPAFVVACAAPELELKLEVLVACAVPELEIKLEVFVALPLLALVVLLPVSIVVVFAVPLALVVKTESRIWYTCVSRPSTYERYPLFVGRAAMSLLIAALAEVPVGRCEPSPLRSEKS